MARQLLENVQPVGVLQIQGHRPFVAVQILEIRAVPIHEIWGVVAARHFDLDDLCTPVRQLPDGRGPGAGAREVEDGVRCQRCGCGGLAHRCSLSAGPVRRTGEARTSCGNVDDQVRSQCVPSPLCLMGRLSVPRLSTRRVIIP